MRSTSRPIAATLPFDLCIWAGGFVGHSLAWNSGLKVNQQGQALVDSQLRSVSHPAVHVIGDLATVAPELTPQMPMGCKSAMPAGAWAAENIARRLRGLPEQPLQYGVPFFCVSLGRRDGLIQMAARDGSMTGRVLTASARRVVQGVHLPQHDLGAEDGAHRHLRHSVGARPRRARRAGHLSVRPVDGNVV